MTAERSAAAPGSLVVTPIGVVRSPYTEKVQAPRQPSAARGVRGRIELATGMNLEHAVDDLATWDHIWVVFWFHEGHAFRPKVLPPRSSRRIGVLATRSPHRPNPIGLSVVRLEAVDGLVLSICDVDMIDGTPVLDIKPYVPWADAVPGASTGWVEDLAESPADPEPGYEVVWSERAELQRRWLDARGPSTIEAGSSSPLSIAQRVDAALALGPQPHPYRRIRRRGDEGVLATKEWRVRFRVDGRRVTVEELASGYRPRQLHADPSPALALHREFVAAWGEAPWAHRAR